MGRFPAPVWSGKYLLQEPTQPPHAAEVHDLLGGRATRGLRREPRGDRLGGQVGGVKHVRQPERRKARSTDELFGSWLGPGNEQRRLAVRQDLTDRVVSGHRHHTVSALEKQAGIGHELEDVGARMLRGKRPESRPRLRGHERARDHDADPRFHCVHERFGKPQSVPSAPDQTQVKRS